MSLTLTFDLTPPYDFARTADAARYYAVFGRRVAGGYRRALNLGDAAAVIDLRPAGDTRLQASVIAARGTVDPAALADRVRRVANAGDDLRPFYAAVDHDPAMRATVTALNGLHSFQLDTVWEALGVTLIEQQISLKQAQIAERWLIDAYGDLLEADGERYGLFPPPERIAALTVDDLRPLKITFGRMERLLTIARRISAGTLDLERLRDAPLDEAYATLRTLSGVGHWTAAWTLIRARGAFYELGGADVALRAAVNHYVYGLPGRCDPPTLAAYFAQFGAWAGRAQFYVITRWAFDRLPGE